MSTTVGATSIGSFLGSLFGIGNSSPTYPSPSSGASPYQGDTANFGNSALAYQVVAAYQQYQGRQPSPFEIQVGVNTIQSLGYPYFVSEISGGSAGGAPIEPYNPQPQPYNPQPQPYYPQPQPYYPQPQPYNPQPSPYTPPAQSYPYSNSSIPQSSGSPTSSSSGPTPLPLGALPGM